MKNTKITATFGPACESELMIEQLLKAGVDVFRFNFSHDTAEGQVERMNRVRKVSKALGLYVGVMLDTKGPEIRTHLFKGDKVTVMKGSTISIHTDKEILGDANSFSVTYEGLFDDVEIGGQILVDDGYLQLTVVAKSIETKVITAIAQNTHSIKNRRGINVPNTVLKMPFISTKDYNDILVACDNDFDYIAASFTRRASDIRAIREILKEKGKPNIQIIAKIENQEAIDNLDEIIDETDGVMVARGDLGVEIPPEELPHLQKEMIRQSQRKGKFVIVATQMLESMQENPRPTRAEVSDIANAVYEAADSTMLSGETAAGKYPIESVNYMNRVQTRTEDEVEYIGLIEEAFKYSKNDINEILSFSAARSALKGQVKGIVAYGVELAKTVSKYRPDVPILAFVDNYKEAAQLSVYYGVRPVLTKEELNKYFTKLYLKKGDIIINLKDGKLDVHMEK